MGKTTEKSKPAKQAGAKVGTFLGVVILDPAVRPEGTTVTAIRKAVKAAVKRPSKAS